MWICTRIIRQIIHRIFMFDRNELCYKSVTSSSVEKSRRATDNSAYRIGSKFVNPYPIYWRSFRSGSGPKSQSQFFLGSFFSSLFISVSRPGQTRIRLTESYEFLNTPVSRTLNNKMCSKLNNCHVNISVFQKWTE